MNKKIFLSPIIISALVIVSMLFVDLKNSYAQSPSPTPTPSPSPSPVPTTEDDIYAEKVLLENIKLEKLGSSRAAITVARDRQVTVKTLMNRNAKKFLEVALDDSIRSQLLPEAQVYVEKQGIIQGNLRILQVDDLTNSDNSEILYTLSADKEYTIISPNTIDVGNLGTVKAAGFALDNLIVLNAGKSSVVPLSAGQDGTNALGNQRVLGLITEMTGYQSPLTIADATKVLFSTTSPFQIFYKTQSAGKIQFTGAVYKISLNRAPSITSCDSGLSIEDPDVVSAINAQGINLANYDRVVFIPNAGNCSIVGKEVVTVGGTNYTLSQSWVSWNDFKTSLITGKIPRTLAHEMGHALGLMHANALICEQGNTSCRHQEYGNYFDMMGTGVGDFNALYKEQLKWLTASDFLTISTNGFFTIRSLDASASTTGVRAAKIINPSVGANGVMYIERRQNATEGRDGTPSSQKNSILLNMPQDPSYIKTSNSEIRDITPGIPAGNGTVDNTNVGMNSGSSPYTLPGSGVTLSEVDINPISEMERASFRVAIQNVTCVSKAPETTPSISPVIYTPGATVFVGVNMKNVDPFCASPSNFVMEMNNLPSGWSVDTVANPRAQAIGVLPDASANLGVYVKIPFSATAGSYPLSYTIRNTTAGISSSGQNPVIVGEGPKIISVNKTSVPIGGTIIMKVEAKGATKIDVLTSGPEYIKLYSGPLPTDGMLTLGIPTTLDTTNSLCTTNCNSRPTPIGNYVITLYALKGASQTVPLTITSAIAKANIENVFTASVLNSLDSVWGVLRSMFGF